MPYEELEEIKKNNPEIQEEIERRTKAFLDFCPDKGAFYIEEKKLK